MTHTQKQPKSTNFDASRAVPQRVGKHRPAQCDQPKPSKAKTVLQVLSTIVITFIAMNGLVFLGAYTPFGGAA